jgi:excisionase family DNA binding protein
MKTSLRIENQVTTVETDLRQLFTATEVAHILHISRSQIYVLWASGELGSVSIRGSRRISEEQIWEYIRQLESNGGRPWRSS